VPKRIIFPHDEVNVGAAAIDWALSTCESAKCDLMICTPFRDQVYSSLDDIFSQQSIGRMARRQSVIEGNVNVLRESIRTLKPSGWNGVILALYHGATEMKKIDKIPCEAIVYVPCTPTDYEQWRSQWEPRLISGHRWLDKSARAVLREYLRTRKS
jgi:hypothetical protein